MKKRTSIVSLILIIAFLLQSNTLIQTEARITEESVSFFINEIKQNDIRKIVLHFESKKEYTAFLESNTVKLEFPNLKMVMIEGYYEKSKIQAQFPDVASVFDITNSKMYRIDPPVEPIYTVSSQDVKKTVASKDLLNVQPLWDLGYKGDNIIFYDVDTGINPDHLDFQGRIMNESKSFINTIYGWNYNDSSIVDTQGHGTHTTGIGAGAGIANPLYIGMAPEAEILIARISDGRSTADEVFLAAYDYGLSVGVDVVSVSWGGGDTEGMDLHELAVEELIKQGVVYCTSAGNEGEGGFHTVGSPGAAPNSISVAGTTDTGSRYTVSSNGPSADGYAKPDIAAPGQDIMSCGIIGTDDYIMKSGTSMACPHIAGIATVLIQALQDLGIQYDPHLVKAALMKASDPGPYSNLNYGAGIPDLELALNLIQAAPTNGTGFPSIIWAIPSFPPAMFNALPQGFHAEMFVQSVSSTPYSDMVPLLTGNISALVSLNTTSWTGSGSKNYYLAFDIPDDMTIGFYDGLITFETAGGVTASTYISVNVIEGRSKILYAKSLSGLNENNFLGIYSSAITDLLEDGIAVNEFRRYNITGEINTITEELLQDYQAVWIADPWDYGYTDFQDNTTRYTYHVNPNYYDEIALIQQFVTDGGSLLMNVEGSYMASYSGYDPFLVGHNTTLINEFLSPFEIAIAGEPYVMDIPEKAQISTFHIITDGVSNIDHFGTYLTVTGSSKIVARYNYQGICAVRENVNGGRIVVVSNNVFMDTTGYKNLYSSNTQNKIFTQNLFRWLVAKEKIIGSYVEDSTGVDFSIRSYNPAAILSATVTIDSSTSSVSLFDEGLGTFSYRMDYAEEAIYIFKVTTADDLYVEQFLYDATAPYITSGSWTNNTVPTGARLDFEITDATTDLTTKNVKLNGESISLTGSGKSYSFVIFTSSLEEGDNILEIFVSDSAGNVLEVTYIIPTVEETETPVPTSTEENIIPTFVILLSLFGIASIVILRRRK
ncbi:MAG: S8 family peptidase [Candidatus Heimdallarchaeaceae archaeon]